MLNLIPNLVLGSGTKPSRSCLHPLPCPASPPPPHSVRIPLLCISLSVSILFQSQDMTASSLCNPLCGVWQWDDGSTETDEEMVFFPAAQVSLAVRARKAQSFCVFAVPIGEADTG